MPQPARRSPCPIACTLDLIGDRWTLLLIRDMCLGRQTFKEFSASPEGIATNILSSRLKKLLTHELIEAFEAEDREGRVGYRLTKKGESLRPVVDSILKWGLKHIEGTAAKMKPR